MTRYVVVKVTDAEGHLVEVGRTTASSDKAAIKAVSKHEEDPMMDGAYAVPERSWKLRKPERKVSETTLWT